MGKKNSGGKNFKKQKKESTFACRELIFKDNDQSYAKLIKKLGDSRFECECFGLGINKIAHVRGILKNKIWMNVGDIVLVSLRDFDESKCDIIHKYSHDDALTLKSYGEIHSSVNLQATPLNISSNEYCDVEFNLDSI